MGLGIYKRLHNKNIILYGYDNNSKSFSISKKFT